MRQTSSVDSGVERATTATSAERLVVKRYSLARAKIDEKLRNLRRELMVVNEAKRRSFAF